jgi:hypothetical protein
VSEPDWDSDLPAELELCSCGENYYDANRYGTCYACYLERRSEYLTCIECGVRWHSPDFALCFQCARGPDWRGRQEAARTLRLEILMRDDFTCRICATAPATQVDHLRPCNSGGNARPWNLQAVCGPCNRAKGSTWWQGCRWDEVRRSQMADYLLGLRCFLNDEERAALRDEVNQWRQQNGFKQTVRSL